MLRKLKNLLQSQTDDFSVKQLLKHARGVYTRLSLLLSPILMLLVLIKSWDSFAIPYSETPVMYCLQYVLMSYCFCLCFALTAQVVRGEKVDYKDLFKVSFLRFLSLLLFAVFFVCLVLAFVHALFYIASHLLHNAQLKSELILFCLFFFSLPLFFLITKFFLVIPLVMSGESSLVDALQIAPQLVYGASGKAFQIVLIFFAFYLITADGSRHYNWLVAHYLIVPFEFLAFIIFMPLLCAMVYSFLDYVKCSDTSVRF